MDYENESWMKVYRRDTAGWADLDIFARGICLELGRHLDAKGELPLGRKGLPAVAATLRTTWERIEEFVLELIADGRLVHDAARQVLIDPQHEERQRARANAATRKRMEREKKNVSRGVTRGHAASRGVTNRSDQKRSDQSLPTGEDARAPESPPAASEPEPEPVVHRDLKPANVTELAPVSPFPTKIVAAELDAPIPPWATTRLEVVAMHTGIQLDAVLVWGKYVARRARELLPVSEPDFAGWVMDQVKYERRDRERERDMAAERAARPPPSSGYLPRGGLLEIKPAPYHGVDKVADAERKRAAKDAAKRPREAVVADARGLLAALGGR